MDVPNACVFLWRIFIIALWPLSLTEGFSVVLKPFEGYNERYTDVTFTGSVISLTCGVEKIDIDETNTSIYLNEMLIFQSGERYKLINGIRLFRNGYDNAYRLQINNVTLEHGGNYTCMVQLHGYTERDSFILKVVSDSPRCITHCNELKENCQLLCYSRPLTVEEYFTWEESEDGSTFERVHNFVPLRNRDKAVAILNTSYHNVFKRFKCSIEMTNDSHTHLLGSCIFHFVVPTRDSYQLETDQSTTFNNIPTNNVTLKASTNSVETKSTIIFGTDFKSKDYSESLHVFVGGSCVLFLAVVFSFIFFCIITRKKPKKHKCNARNGPHQTDGWSNTSCVHGGCQAENMLSTSLVLVPGNHHLLHPAEHPISMADNTGGDILGITDPLEQIYYEITTDEPFSNIRVIDKYEEPNDCVDKKHASSVLYIVEKEKFDCNSPLSTENSPKQWGTENMQGQKDEETSEMVDNIVYEK